MIDELLAEQRQLTAVERFSQHHDRETNGSHAKFYHDLIPLTKPQVGQQYAFEVDLDRCSGCKACVSACHSLNGLDDEETWRDVGLLFSNDWRQPFQQTVTTACHHCVDPGCLNGCPVLAYDKDPLTGIVRHLDDQCIGCQYCVMKCPYDVPKYSEKRGIVRKCDMCSNRLAANEAPACAQACPHEAIKITIVDTAAIAETDRREQFLPCTPDSGYTLPTTRYKSARPLPANLLAGNHSLTTPADSHLPLVFMLVLTQLSVGAITIAAFTTQSNWLAVVAAGIGALALNIASLHLGKPLKAWRAFLGWRKSWFSREVILFGGFVPLAALSATTFWLPALAAFQKPVTFAAAIVGLLGVACSAMIYVDTRREFWNAAQCFGKFLGTTLLLGLATTVAVEVFTQDRSDFIHPLIALLLLTTAAKLVFEHRIFRHLVDENTPTLTSLNKTARLIEDQLGLAFRLRMVCGLFGGLILPLILIAVGASAHAPAIATAILILCITGELLERYLFFRAVAPVNMPGGVAA